MENKEKDQRSLIKVQKFQELLIPMVQEILSKRMGLDVKLFKCKNEQMHPKTKKITPCIGMKIRSKHHDLEEAAKKYNINMKYDHNLEDFKKRKIFPLEMSEIQNEANKDKQKK